MDGYFNDGEPETASAPSSSPSLDVDVDNSFNASLYDQTKTGNLTKNLYMRDQKIDQSEHKSWHLHFPIAAPLPASNGIRAISKRFSTLPAISPHFVYIGDRHKTLIEGLKQQLKQYNSIAIHGLIGTGKWEMALQVAHAILLDKDIDINHSFCVTACSASAFQRDYENIARQVGIRCNSTKSVQCLLEDVNAWLQDPKNGTWVLLLDDTDISIIKTEGFERETDNKASGYVLPGKYLPRLAPHGYMIITTDDENVARHFISPRQKPVRVPLLETAEAFELLRSRITEDSIWTDSPSSQRDAKRLVYLLDNHPSAIILAAAYINLHYEGGETIASYVEKLASDKNLELLSKDSYDSLSGYGFPSSPIKAWRISFTKIKSEYPRAIEVLALMSCLDQTLISRSLLECYKLPLGELQDHLETLRRYSIINTDDRGKTYQMSHLLQMTAHAWLCDQGERAKSQVEALQTLLKQHDKIQEESQGTSIPAYVRQRQLLPHVDVFERYCRKEGFPVDSIEEITPAIVSFARLYAGEGRYGPAQRFLCYVRDNYQGQDLWRITALRNLAEAIRSQSPTLGETREERSENLKKARKELREARGIAEKIEDRSAEIDVLASLALNYSDVSHLKPAETFQTDIKRYFDLAEKFQKVVIAHKTIQHDDSHLERIAAILGLSKILFRRGRNLLELSNGILDSSNTEQNLNRKAQKDLKRAKTAQVELLTKMELQIEQFPNDAERISVLNDIRAALARSYFYLRKFQDAEKQARAAYEGRLVLFGQYDLKTLGTEEDLSACLLEQGQFEEAEKRLQGVLERLREKFGESGYFVERCEGKLRDLGTRKGMTG